MFYFVFMTSVILNFDRSTKPIAPTMLAATTIALTAVGFHPR